MRGYVLTDEAKSALESRIQYLLDRHADRASQELLVHVETFLTHALCLFPAMGQRIEQKDIWETWIPGTRIVLWDRFDDEMVTVITLWHTAQDRFS